LSGISIIFLCFGLIAANDFEAPESAQSIRRVRPSARFSQSFSKPRNTLNLESEVGVRVWKKNEVRIFSNLERRKFSGGRTFKDYQLGLGTLLFPHSKFYLDISGAHTPGVDFLPKWEFQGTPHVVAGIFDFSLGVRWRNYSTVKTFSLKPGATWELSDSFRLATFIDISLKPEKTVSGGVSANVTWSQLIETRLSLSGGRSDEGDGVFDDFTDIHMGFLFPILSQLSVGLDGGFRTGNLRDELSYGILILGKF